MKTKMTVTLGILVAGLLIAFVAWAQKAEKRNDRREFRDSQSERHGDKKEGEPCHRKDGERGGGFHSERMMGNLGLSADQRAKVDGILAENKKTTEPVRAEAKAIRDKMRAEWEAAAPNEGTLISLQRKIHDIEGKLAEQRIAARVAIIAILTDKQRVEMRERMADRGPRHGRDHGKGKGFHQRRGGFGLGPDAE
jgi:Spy/CpxP family protein refolding chaperone